MLVTSIAGMTGAVYSFAAGMACGATGFLAVFAAFGSEVDAYIEKRGEKYHLDLKQINAMVLRRCGVEQIDLSRDCTVCSCDRFWSHRATGGQRGSQGAIIVCQEDTI